MESKVSKKIQTRTKVALWLLIGPTGSIIVSLGLFLIVNFAFTLLAPIPADGEPLAGPYPINTVINVILLVIGAIGTMSLLPGIIAGIVLLTTGKPYYAKN